MFDGWSHHGTHYVGVFGLYESIHNAGIAGVSSGVELAITPLLNEGDLGAESRIDCSGATLSVFRKSRENVISLVGEKKWKILNLQSLPIFGCASQRMILAVKSYIQDFENLHENIHLLMKKLNSVKNRAMLRRKGATVCPVLRCKTRWSGDYAMFSWFLEIRVLIDSSD